MGRQMKFAVIALAVVTCLFVATSIYFICNLGCDGDSCRQQVPCYTIGLEYENDYERFSLIHDQQNERYIYNFTDKNDEKKAFYFVFKPQWQGSDDFDSYFKNDSQTIRHPYYVFDNEFEITDENGNDIVFNEEERYLFYGNETIYISYKNASQIIKDKITNNFYEIHIALGYFRP